MKSNSRRTVEFELTEAMSTGVPDRPKSRLGKTFALLGAAALFYGAAFGLAQPAQADGAFTVAGINSTLPAWSQPANSEESSQPRQQTADDSTFSALTSFAQQIGADAPKSVSASSQFDGQTYAALRDFAQRLGTAQPQSAKALPKVAEAKSLFEFLQQGGTAAPAATGPVAGGTTSRAPVEATYVDGKVCLTCHANQAATFEKTLMGRIGKTQKGKFECQNCHGPGSAHVKAGGGRGVGGIISFRPEDQSRTAQENNALCLGCHEKGERTYWSGSVHENRGLMCTNCHTIMKQVSRKFQIKTVFEPDTCFQCHKDRRAQMWRSSHMPLREGKITCSDCHNPHGSFTDALLRENSINDNCYKCHADKRGPFLFEHTPVRENCSTCHDPHGSVYENDLRHSKTQMCGTCHGFGHGLTSGPASVQNMNRACLNCHTAIHGTNNPSGPLLHR